MKITGFLSSAALALAFSCAAQAEVITYQLSGKTVYFPAMSNWEPIKLNDRDAYPEGTKVTAVVSLDTVSCDLQIAVMELGRYSRKFQWEGTNSVEFTGDYMWGFDLKASYIPKFLGTTNLSFDVGSEEGVALYFEGDKAFITIEESPMYVFSELTSTNGALPSIDMCQ